MPRNALPAGNSAPAARTLDQMPEDIAQIDQILKPNDADIRTCSVAMKTLDPYSEPTSEMLGPGLRLLAARAMIDPAFWSCGCISAPG